MGRLEAGSRVFLENLERRLERMKPEKKEVVLSELILGKKRPEVVKRAFEFFAGLYPGKTAAISTLLQKNPGRAAAVLKELGFAQKTVLKKAVEGASQEEAAFRTAAVLKGLGRNHFQTAGELWKRNTLVEHVYSALVKHFGPGDEKPVEALAALGVGHKGIAELLKKRRAEPLTPKAIMNQISAHIKEIVFKSILPGLEKNLEEARALAGRGFFWAASAERMFEEAQKTLKVGLEKLAKPVYEKGLRKLEAARKLSKLIQSGKKELNEDEVKAFVGFAKETLVGPEEIAEDAKKLPLYIDPVFFAAALRGHGYSSKETARALDRATERGGKIIGLLEKAVYSEEQVREGAEHIGVQKALARTAQARAQIVK